MAVERSSGRAGGRQKEEATPPLSRKTCSINPHTHTHTLTTTTGAHISANVRTKRTYERVKEIALRLHEARGLIIIIHVRTHAHACKTNYCGWGFLAPRAPTQAANSRQLRSVTHKQVITMFRSKIDTHTHTHTSNASAQGERRPFHAMIAI